jgi:hypothetical protein
VALLAGVGSAGYALAIIPEATTGFPVLAGMVAAGILMFLGTVGGSGAGPNNSSKPTPLRGAA